MFIKKSEYESLLKQIENLERDLRIANSHADYWKNQYINSRLGIESCDDCLNMIKMFDNVTEVTNVDEIFKDVPKLWDSELFKE